MERKGTPMQTHRSLPLVGAVVAGVVISGCVTDQVARLHTGSDLFTSTLQVDESSRTASRDAVATMYAGLGQAAEELHLADAETREGDRGIVRLRALPEALLEDSLMRKTVDSNLRALTTAGLRSRGAGETCGPPEDVTFDSSDFEKFLESTLPALGYRAWVSAESADAMGSADGARASDTEVGGLIQEYLIAYFQGEFVDRRGVTLAKPAISATGVSNETIGGFFAVVWEAIYDGLYSVPVLYRVNEEEREWLTQTGERPTCVALGHAEALPVSEATPVTLDEALSIGFVSRIAGAESSAISGWVLRLFSDVEVSMIVGADFAIGDNDTLATLADVFFEVGSRRTAEAIAFGYFRSHDQRDYGSSLGELVELVRKIYDALRAEAVEVASASDVGDRGAAPVEGADSPFRIQEAQGSTMAEVSRFQDESSGSVEQQALALVIGINRNDRNHYPKLRPLKYAESDAMAMQRIALHHGFEIDLLLGPDATYESVRARISNAAAILRPGDIYLLSYAGHGGYRPDANEEADGRDETWCLYDRQMIDDEIHEALMGFDEGVRVVVVSDSCHSATVTRFTAEELASHPGVGVYEPAQFMTALSDIVTSEEGNREWGALGRALPLTVAFEMFRQNRGLYAADSDPLGDETHGDLRCSLISLSACEDNESALEEAGNGVFTAAIVSVWRDGSYEENYEAFLAEIAQLAAWWGQHPQYRFDGLPQPGFEAQSPFDAGLPITPVVDTP